MTDVAMGSQNPRVRDLSHSKTQIPTAWVGEVLHNMEHPYHPSAICNAQRVKGRPQPWLQTLHTLPLSPKVGVSGPSEPKVPKPCPASFWSAPPRKRQNSQIAARGGATPTPRSTHDTIHVRAIRPKSPRSTMSCSAPQAAKKSVFALHTAFSSDFYDMLSTLSELVRPDFEISD